MTIYVDSQWTEHWLTVPSRKNKTTKKPDGSQSLSDRYAIFKIDEDNRWRLLKAGVTFRMKCLTKYTNQFRKRAFFCSGEKKKHIDSYYGVR
ncbi:hypothetical protein DDR33_15700 [Pararcticibacter amylolyticus]|uniref:Uncharacterized protein n=1 Tax=Pararcticibacter amylolyticus TaxID=2173175 RepID=A0A2U2PEL8_9SPHI|nr:hypothetical protein DDR33_15700 [Pararcticibacter amylolyticus]